MNQTPAETPEIAQRLNEISATLESLRTDNTALHKTYLESNEEYTRALRTFQESDEKYRKELEIYQEERRTKAFATNIGAILRIVAVVLLAYIALKVS
jgi:uncharacterized membrane protein YkgB